MKLSIPILMYHQVSQVVEPGFYKNTVKVDTFKTQMNMLKKLGYKSVAISDLRAYKEKSKTPPGKPIIITFDDCLEDAIENAVPVLEESGFSAVFYIPTEYVGGKSTWMLHKTGIEFKIADWQKVKDLASRGFEIGSHTMTHPHLNTISSEDCTRELQESRNILEDALGTEVRNMAYPYGAFDERVTTVASNAGYYTACTTEPEIADLNNDLLKLPRLNVGMEDNILDFLFKIHTAHTPTNVLKRRIHRIRGSIPVPARRLLKKLLGYTNSK